MDTSHLFNRKHKLSAKKQIGIETIDLLKNETQSENLSRLRIITKPTQYSELIHKLLNYPSRLTQILSVKHKKNIKELDFPHLVFFDFDIEFFWAKSIILNEIDGINKFVKLSKEYSTAILLNNFETAGKVLELIESSFGQSIWLIKNKIAFLQISQGLEAQKKYSQDIKNELRQSSLVRFVAHWFSVRNENQTSSNRFVSQVEIEISKINANKNLGYHDYCRYHLLVEDFSDPNKLIQILRLEYSTSIIDYYEAFVALTQCILMSNDEKLKSRIYRLFANQKVTFADNRLLLIGGLITSTNDIPFSTNESVECWDLMLNGHYQLAENKALIQLETYPDDPLLISIVAHSIALSNKDISIYKDDDKTINLRQQIIKNIAIILREGTVKAAKELNEINKVILNFSSFSWTYYISLIVKREELPFNAADHTNCQFLKVAYVHPALIPHSTVIKDKYSEFCDLRFGPAIACQYYRFDDSSKIETGDKKLDIGFQSYFLGITAYKNGDYNNAIIQGDTLIRNSNPYFVRRGYSIISNSYLKLNDLKSVTRVIADCYIKRKDFFNLLPLFEIRQAVRPEKQIWEILNSEIDLPIVFDAIHKNIDRTAEPELRFSYEDFLTVNGCGKPSELKGLLRLFEFKKIVYYLRYVCVETNMDTSSAFAGGSHEVLAERLAICRLLYEIDTENQTVYEKEIKELVRRQVINNRRQEVDQSRIYVDIDSVREFANKELSETYSRYIEYLKIGLNKKDNSPKNKNSISLSANGINVPDDEVRSLFQYMIEEITDAYVGSDFGLNRFLSTRVRHGILEGKLRKPIENHKLITKKQTKNGPYLSNEYWLDKVGYTDVVARRNVERAFAKFSEAYDQLIQTILDGWLQIYQSNKPYGLFNFHLSVDDTERMFNDVIPGTQFGDFINKVINTLEQTLVVNLIGVRKELNTKAKQQAKALLNSLQESIGFWGNSVGGAELNNSINQARTDLQNQFDIITEWFVPSSTGSAAPFLIEDSIYVAEALLHETAPLFKIEINSDEDNSFPIHGQLPIFVDIFVNIFENVVKRSGLDEPKAFIQIDYEHQYDDFRTINIRIENEIVSDDDIQEVDKELKRKKSLLMGGDYAQYLAKEGNSGLFKIHKSVMDFEAVGSSIKPKMDFGIVDNRFQISLNIPFRLFDLIED